VQSQTAANTSDPGKAKAPEPKPAEVKQAVPFVPPTLPPATIKYKALSEFMKECNDIAKKIADESQDALPHLVNTLKILEAFVPKKLWVSGLVEGKVVPPPTEEK